MEPEALRRQCGSGRAGAAVLALYVAVALVPCAGAGAGEKRLGKGEFVPTAEHVLRTIEGWPVRVNPRLLKGEADLGRKALKLLETKLYEVRRMVPEAACRELRKVTIWLGVDDGHAPCAEYHPSAAWLRKNGYNPDKAKCVEIGNASRFIAWSKQQPAMVLHELAHAYQDQVLGERRKEVAEAYRAAKEGGTYDSILGYNGRKRKAYAMNNPQEYFAETTEAYFGTNDMYPFVRGELKAHDPRMAKLLEDLWLVKGAGWLEKRRKAEAEAKR
ncbi:MAG: hypothetical protein ACYTKD_27145 [Planctomycetota bacterium]|jgi:hypothetical protein